MSQDARLLTVAVELRLMARQSAHDEKAHPTDHPLSDRLTHAAEALEDLVRRSLIESSARVKPFPTDYF